MIKLPKTTICSSMLFSPLRLLRESRSGMEQRAVLAELCPFCWNTGIATKKTPAGYYIGPCPKCQGKAGENENTQQPRTNA